MSIFALMKIVKATLADIPLINKMAWQVFPLTYRDIITKEQIDFMMDWMYSPANLEQQITKDHHTYLIAYDEQGRAQGYVSVQPQGVHLWHLQKIYVLPEYQQQHLGSALFHAAVDFIKEQEQGKPFTLELNVNRHNKAKTFYEHMGMHVDREVDDNIGNDFYMNDYIMQMQVNSCKRGGETNIF